MAQPVIIEAVRTPIGKRNGWLSGLRAPDILGAAQVEVVKRAGIDPASVEQVVGGCVTQAGEQGFNVTRTSWLLAGLPYDVAATTIDCQCGSSQQANHMANNLIAAGAVDTAIGCGVETMSRIPLGANASAPGVGPGHPRGPALRHARASSRRPSGSPRSTASPARTSTGSGWSRRRRPPGRVAEDRFAREIVAVEAPDRRRGGPAGRAQRREDGRLQGPGPARHDGRGPGQAQARAARRHAHGRERRRRSPTARPPCCGCPRSGPRPRASSPGPGSWPRCSSGSDPYYHLDGPIVATTKVLAKAGMTMKDIDLFEVNEAFASIVHELGQGARGRHGQAERQRRRHRARPPGRRDGQPADHHDPARARADATPPTGWCRCAAAARWRRAPSSSGSEASAPLDIRFHSGAYLWRGPWFRLST